MESNLRQFPLLSGLSAPQMQRVLTHTRLVTLTDGQWLFRQADPARYFYGVQQGQMRLFRLSIEGEEKIIELIGAGQTFAEALMFMGTDRYPVCAAAISATTLVAIDSADFATMLRESPGACFALLANLSQRLHALITEIDHLSLHSAQGRIARWLLKQGNTGADPFNLDAPKAVLASRLSITPETWSRITRRLSTQGLITVSGPTIRILNLEGLRECAEDNDRLE